MIELGIAGNGVALARLGAKAIALDPDPDRIADLRAAATTAGIAVECHHGELADLGFAPSGTIDVVIASHTLDHEDDLGRTLRQVHRVLKPGAPFVIALAHPFAGLTGPGAAGRRYGDDGRTIGDLLTALAGRTSASRRSTSSAWTRKRRHRPRSSSRRAKRAAEPANRPSCPHPRTGDLLLAPPRPVDTPAGPRPTTSQEVTKLKVANARSRASMSASVRIWACMATV